MSVKLITLPEKWAAVGMAVLISIVAWLVNRNSVVHLQQEIDGVKSEVIRNRETIEQVLKQHEKPPG